MPLLFIQNKRLHHLLEIAQERKLLDNERKELENLLERALIFAEGEVITEEDLDLPKTSSTVVSTEEILSAPSLGSTLWELERRAITECLLKWEGNQTKAAEELGITRRTMFNKIKEYGLAISG
jgi:two-component system response regulator AtoC